MLVGDECLYAYTECGPYLRYPAYVNVTRRATDGCYEISVRSRDTCSAGFLILTPAQFLEFRESLTR